MAYDAGFVDQEQATQGDGFTNQDVVVASDLLVEVGDERIIDLTEATLISRRVSPSQVRVVAVDGNADDLNAEVAELLAAIRKSDDFGRANKGEVERIKEQKDVFAFELAERKFAETSVGKNGLSFEFGCGFGN